jgi:hypothetical protein
MLVRERRWRSFSEFRGNVPSTKMICNTADFIHELMCQLYSATDIDAGELAMCLTSEAQWWEGRNRKPREETLELVGVQTVGCLEDMRSRATFQAPPPPPPPEPPPPDPPETPADAEENSEIPAEAP